LSFSEITASLSCIFAPQAFLLSLHNPKKAIVDLHVYFNESRDFMMALRNRIGVLSSNQAALEIRGDSKNVLTDFDMALALTQQAINTQLQFAWKAWVRRKNIGDELVLPKFRQNKQGQQVPAIYGIRAKLAPITIDFNVPNGKLGQVNATLHLQSGVVNYFDEETEDKATYPIENWSVTVTVDLDKKPVDLKALGEIDPDAKNIASDTIAKSGLPESVFSIEYLFLKFTNTDLLLSGGQQVQIPQEVPQPARTKALESLNLLLQREMGEFMLGTVVRRNREQATPTFAMTDFIFHVDPNAELADASTLSYLGMFSKRNLPRDRNAARIKLNQDWIRPDQINGQTATISGVLAIRKEKFFDEYLIPLFTQQFGFAPTVHGNTRTYSKSEAGRLNPNNIGVQHILHLQDDYSCNITLVPGTNILSISGTISSSRRYEERTLPTLGIPNGLQSLEVKGEGRRTFSASIALTAEGIGTEFSIHPDLDNLQFAPIQTSGETSGFAKVTQAFQNLFGIPDMQTMLGSAAQQKVNEISNVLQGVLSRIDIDLSKHQFIPPGGGVFTFQNLHFSDQTGDLIMDVIYQAP
jgi:hypothetical protein